MPFHVFLMIFLPSSCRQRAQQLAGLALLYAVHCARPAEHAGGVAAMLALTGRLSSPKKMDVRSLEGSAL